MSSVLPKELHGQKDPDLLKLMAPVIEKLKEPKLSYKISISNLSGVSSVIIKMG